MLVVTAAGIVLVSTPGVPAQGARAEVTAVQVSSGRVASGQDASPGPSASPQRADGEASVVDAAFPGDRDLRSPQVLAAAIRDDRALFRLIDVRTPAEYAAGHVPSAENIDYRRIGEELAAGNRDEPIVVYCKSGNRSARAARTLKDLGYTTVIDFGGINRWNGPIQNGPIQTEDQ